MQDLFNFIFDLFKHMAENTSSNNQSPAWIGAAIGAVASVASSIFGKKSVDKSTKWSVNKQQEFNLQNMEIQQQYNKELLALQNDYSVANWERENEYNLPIHQRERLLDAGINPNFADVISSGDSGSVSSPGLPSAPSSQGPDVASAQNAAANAQNSSMNIGKTIADSAKSVAETALVESETKIKSTTARYTEQVIQGNLDLVHTQVNLGSAQTQNEYEKFFVIAATARKIDEEVGFVQQNIDYLKEQTNLARQNYENAKKSLDLINEQIRTTKLQGNLFEEEANSFYENSETARILRDFQKQILVSQDLLNQANAANVDEQTKYTKYLEGVAEADRIEKLALAALHKADTEKAKAEANVAYQQAHWLKVQAAYHPAYMDNLTRYYGSLANLSDEQVHTAQQMTRLVAAQAFHEELTGQALNQPIQIPVRTQDGRFIYISTKLATAQGVMSLQLDAANAWKAFQQGNYTEHVNDWYEFNQYMQSAQQIVGMVNQTVGTIGSLVSGSGSGGVSGSAMMFTPQAWSTTIPFAP